MFKKKISEEDKGKIALAIIRAQLINEGYEFAMKRVKRELEQCDLPELSVLGFNLDDLREFWKDLLLENFAEDVDFHFTETKKKMRSN